MKDTWKRRPLKEQVKDLLTLHASERGAALLLMLVLVFLSTLVSYEQWFREPPVADLEPLEREMNAWLAEAREQAAQDSIRLQPFPFDPNTTERSEWLALGLSDRQVDGVERYMAKGGRFRVKNDLGRMYSIPAEQFERLKPFIQLPDDLPIREIGKRPSYAHGSGARQDGGPRADHPTYERREAVHYAKVEVNTADSAELVALPGIGPSFAKGILKYREMLGGYVSLEQMAEVYVLKDKPDALARMKELLIVDTMMVRRIAINTCTVEELAAHPYIRWQLAKPLLAYRNNHGPFKELSELRGCHVIDETVFRKLAPYLTVE